MKLDYDVASTTALITCGSQSMRIEGVTRKQAEKIFSRFTEEFQRRAQKYKSEERAAEGIFALTRVADGNDRPEPMQALSLDLY